MSGDERRPSDGRPIDLIRRKFLARCCAGAGASMIPARLRGLAFRPSSHESSSLDSRAGQLSDVAFHLHPHYRTERPLDATLLKVNPDQDDYVSEKYAARIEKALAGWSADLRQSPPSAKAIESSLDAEFLGVSPVPATSRPLRNDSLRVEENKFNPDATLRPDEFMRALRSSLKTASRFLTADFQITSIRDASGEAAAVPQHANLHTRIHFELVSTGKDFHREQRVGDCEIEWQVSPSGEWLVHGWLWTNETRSRCASPVFTDITAAALGENESYRAQLLHGSDYWRTVLDGACGIDIYGHNGVSVADIDNDGFDDLYVCQPAGLPNRLYRNRGDGTFEDITESSGLGLLENTACALFADFNNDGLQDAIIVRANGPAQFLNEGGGKFREKPDAFRFANPPQGSFTGAAVADYDGDGWLDVYFCLYGYYRGADQYRYPTPYHDAENGPPNFMMRNQRDGTFRDVTTESGLNENNARFSFCCGWNDYNADGWPDLYVVNDFGRKNLYRNNGNGTFTDVAAEAGVEDVGAGMGVCWFDCDHSGAADLYVANMWTAAGERVATQESFQKDAPEEIRALYRKHAMGNSLFRNRVRNRAGGFDEITKSAGVGLGRWAWSSDAFDFDHDGFSDLYVVNGMVSGPSHRDLNSFFWRQVVANSPTEARAARRYEEGWNAINELIRADGTWSGCERNVFYANNRDGTFSDVSGAIGLDFIEDGRAFAIADFDHDGRAEIFLKNRNAPQFRLLKNEVADLPPSIAFRLTGKKSNRDAIGAMISIETDAGKQTRWLQAGSGFLSQHSKELLFGLGEAKSSVNATIRWPSGLVQELRDLPRNHRVWVEEGDNAPRIEPFRTQPPKAGAAADSRPETLPELSETWLLDPIAAPEFELTDGFGRSSMFPQRGKATLLAFGVTASQDCQRDLETFRQRHSAWASRGLQLVAINLDDVADQNKNDQNKNDQKQIQPVRRLPQYSFPVLRGTDEVASVYNILYRQLFDRHRDLSLPTTFLVNARGEIVKVYRGPVDAEHIERDFKNIPATDSERLQRGLPFSITGRTLEVGRNYLSYGSLFFQRGYLDQAGSAFQRALQDDPTSAEAAYGMGSVYLNQNKDAEARQSFESAIKFKASFPGTMADAWNNLGVLATRRADAEESVKCFNEALRLNPHHLLALDNLGNAYRSQKRWEDARAVLERALEVAPEDAEANYSLGMVFAQTADNDRAYEHLRKALKARPVYPEALNNLGILYLVTGRTEQAIDSFQQSIKLAPAFDQSYLNLARVYALKGRRADARALLSELLKQHPGHEQATEMMKQLDQ